MGLAIFKCIFGNQSLKVLITGGCGFVGTNLAIELVNHSYITQILLIDSFLRKENFKNIKIINTLKKIKIIRGNCSIIKKYPNVDLVIHLASDPAVSSGMDYESKIFENNLLSTYNLINYYSKKITPFIFFSSSRVYSIDLINSIKYKLKKNQFFPVTNYIKGLSKGAFNENLSTSGFKSIYGFTKLASEDLISQYSRIYGFNYIINRCSLLAGNYQRGNFNQGIISYIIKSSINKSHFKIIGYNGYQVRDLLDILDLSRLVEMQISHIMENKGVNEIFNVGGGLKNSFSILDVCKYVRSRYGLNFSITKKEKFADIKYYVTSNKKVMNKFNWKPTISVKKAIDKLYNFETNHI